MSSSMHATNEIATDTNDPMDNDSINDAVEEDEDDYDLFSEDSKLQLLTRISTCGCGGFRICKPCFDIYKPTLVNSDSDNKTPLLCKRDTEDGSPCTDDYTSLPIFPCTICRRMEDGGEVTTDWHLDCEQAQDAICDLGVCPGCTGVIVDDVCKVCKYNCDI
jgi:hypothetical protein